MKMHVGAEVLFISALDGGEWSDSHPGHFREAGWASETVTKGKNFLLQLPGIQPQSFKL
jgi:hypothetical protein